MVFLYPQTRHSLIPQHQSEKENLAWATEKQAFRQELFSLLAQKTELVTKDFTESKDSEKIYRHVRRELDSMPELQALHERRRELQDRLWSLVANDVARDAIASPKYMNQLFRSKIEEN